MTNASDNLYGEIIKTSNVPFDMLNVEPFVMVIFGGTGDLSKRKLLPAIFNLYAKDKLPKEFSILGIGSRQITDAEYQNLTKEAINIFSKGAKADILDKFISKLSYLSNDATNSQDYSGICSKIAELKKQAGIDAENILYYLAVPPQLLPSTVEKLKAVNACGSIENSKIIIEKPFGHNRQSAVELNDLVSSVFKEEQVYRIDHYLGKDTVQNIMFFRFGNSIFEPLWNRDYIENVRITVSEEIGIEGRGKFYEKSGVVRDIVQNHLMQLIALVGMEPPAHFDAKFIREERVKLLETIRPLTDEDIDKNMVRGQYGPGTVKGKDIVGYRQEENVAPDSNVPTFFAGKFFIDNWRWADVPFFAAAGKRMKAQSTEIVVQFKKTPLRMFEKTCEKLEPNLLIMRIQPNENIFLQVNVKTPGISNSQHSVVMNFDYENIAQVEKYPAYERLILDVIKGDQTLFARQDGIEAMWSVVDPINKRWEAVKADNFPNYAAGSWGPQAAEELLGIEGQRWGYINKIS